jgi:hypothetical protein
MRFLLPISLILVLVLPTLGGPPEPPGVPPTPEIPDAEELARALDRVGENLDTAKMREMEENLRKVQRNMGDVDIKIAELDKMLQRFGDSVEINDIRIGDDSIVIVLDNDSVIAFGDLRKNPHVVGIGKDDLVGFGSKMTIDEGRIVDGDAVNFFGDILVLGTVTGGVLTFGGDIYVSSTGRIDQSAVAIFGKVKKEPGAQIGTLNLAFDEYQKGPRESTAARTYRIMAFVFLIVYFVWILLSATFYSLMGKNVARVSEQIIRSPWKSFFFGYLSYILAFVLLVALTISVLGIPLAILGVPLLLFAAMVLSSTAISCILGHWALKTEIKNIRIFLLGTLVLSGIPLLFFFLQLITGSLTLMVFSWIFIGIFVFLILPLGLGAVLTTRFGTIEPKPAQPSPIPQFAPEAQRT